MLDKEGDVYMLLLPTSFFLSASCSDPRSSSMLTVELEWGSRRCRNKDLDSHHASHILSIVVSSPTYLQCPLSLSELSNCSGRS